MNKNFQDAKEHFINEGYCSFNLSEFDLEFFYFIKNYLNCNDTKNLNEVFTQGRFDSEDLKTTFIKKSFEEANEYKNSLIKEHDWMVGNRPNMTQCWYWCHIEKIEKFLKKNNEDCAQLNLNKYLNDKIYSIVKYFYELSENVKLDYKETTFTLYNKDCAFTQHSDGVGVNYCSMIIYLNENYNKDYGGLLLLNDEYVIPEIGVVALMDLSKHDVKHGVSKVIGGPGRFAILSFPKIKYAI